MELQLIKNEIDICEEHDAEECVYCEDCHSLSCFFCANLRHKGHNMISINQAYKPKERQLEEKKEQLRGKLQLLSKQYNNISSQKRENDKELMARLQELDLQKERIKNDFDERNLAL